MQKNKIHAPGQTKHENFHSWYTGMIVVAASESCTKCLYTNRFYLLVHVVARISRLHHMVWTQDEICGKYWVRIQQQRRHTFSASHWLSLYRCSAPRSFNTLGQLVVLFSLFLFCFNFISIKRTLVYPTIFDLRNFRLKIQFVCAFHGGRSISKWSERQETDLKCAVNRKNQNEYLSLA